MAIQYGKKCNTNKDCSSNICEMTYKNNNRGAPDTRRCVVKSKSKSKSKKKSGNDTESSETFTKKKCSYDKDCSSGLCEKKYSVDPKTKARIYDGRYCINQEKKFGKDCSYNYDCDSNRCVSTNNKEDKLERKCLIFENAPEIPSRNFGDITDDDLPEGDPQRSAAWKQQKNKVIFLNENQKKKELDGTGPIAEIIVLVMEIVALGIKTVMQMLILCWLFVFKVVSFLPSLLLDIKIFQFAEKYKDSSGKCVDSVTITSKLRTKIIALLFPPYGVFLHLGVVGLKHIFFTTLLTLLFYFPGVMYAINIIDKVDKPTIPKSESFLDNNKLYNMFFYGQLMKDNICIPNKTFSSIMSILFPPFGLYLKQKRDKKVNIKRIIICFILTGLFYFPGLIYALI
jgi:uncharacterized membrane protein YqaE (UPF0057 family)